MNWVANRIPANIFIFFSFIYSPFFICVLFYFFMSPFFLSFKFFFFLFLFPFLAFCFYFFLHCLHKKGERYEIIKVGQKITFLISIMLRSYRGRISKFCYISYNRSTFDFSLFSIFRAIKGVFVSRASISILIFLGRFNPN